MKISRETGFTLLEVLISMVVLSVGLLGMAGLVAVGIKSNHTASYRSQATFLADDILDRMRANRTAAVDDGDYNKVLITVCNPALVPATLPEFDVNDWICRVEQELPEGKGAVTVVTGGTAPNFFGIVTVTLRWSSGLDEDGDGDVDASDYLEFVTTAHL